ncbi:MAG: DUF3341 domain-containing protein [Deltaproteobacteria bacterium]|nr:DUF3341 domain-containing protein [Deltaproteobacteria bacterium]
MARAYNKAVFGIFPSREKAHKAAEELSKAGFRKEDISMMYQENPGSKDLAFERHSKAPEGTTAGGVTGAVAGAAFGWLVGAGTLAIPELGQFAVAGPLVAALAGCGVGTSLGGLVGALVGAGMPEYEAKRYEGRLRKGGVLLSAHCDDHEWRKHALQVLRMNGAEEISSESEEKADYAVGAKPVERGHEGRQW